MGIGIGTSTQYDTTYHYRKGKRIVLKNLCVILYSVIFKIYIELTEGYCFEVLTSGP